MRRLQRPLASIAILPDRTLTHVKHASVTMPLKNEVLYFGLMSDIDEKHRAHMWIAGEPYMDETKRRTLP